MGALPKDRRPVDRLARYGFSAEELDTLHDLLETFRCRDTCGRRRACLTELIKAADRGDTLAERLLSADHCDRLMDDAALAYGRKLGRIYC